ncbi:MAG: methionine adenosyltransferase [Planctomycetota bacterium]|nr:methionine adenosyltransferase [Planctomycetota bacterium]
MSDFMFTSESVTEGHPDKLCDQVSDAIVDRILSQDPAARVVAESAISNGIVFVAARLTATGGMDIPTLVRDVIRRAGYGQGEFDVDNCAVMTSVTQLSLPETQVAEPESDDDGLAIMAVADQATVFGYACDHTPAYQPLPIWMAHKLAHRLAEVGQDGTLPFIAPDGKTQVGIEFHERRPARIHSVSVVACQREADAPNLTALREAVTEEVIKPAFQGEVLKPDDATRYLLNPDGPVIKGGPSVHSGMTGRKTAVDLYGEYSRSSHSALSGKDPTRIDRVGTYAARHAAKNVVAAGLARECEVQLSYSIGLPGPVSVHVNTYGTGTMSDDQLVERVQGAFDFRLGSILRRFGLRRLPLEHEGRFYERLSSYGHVGRADLDLPWERIDTVDALA